MIITFIFVVIKFCRTSCNGEINANILPYSVTVYDQKLISRSWTVAAVKFFIGFVQVIKVNQLINN